MIYLSKGVLQVVHNFLSSELTLVQINNIEFLFVCIQQLANHYIVIIPNGPDENTLKTFCWIDIFYIV